MLDSLRKLHALGSRRDRIQLAVLVAMMVVAAFLEVVGVGSIPVFVSAVVDPEALMGHPWVEGTVGPLAPAERDDFVAWGIAVLIGVFALKNGFLVLYYHLQMRYISDRRTDLARRLVNAYVRAPYPFHLQRNTAELMRNVERETSIIAHQVLAAILEICTRVLILVAVLAFLFVVEPWITLFWLAIFGSIGAVGVMALSAKLKGYGLEEQHCRQRVLQALAQGFGSIKESKILQREQFFADAVSDNVHRMSQAIRFKKFTGAAMNPATEFVAVAGLLLIAGTLVLIGRSTESILVTLSLFIVGLVRLRETVGTAMTHLANLRYNLVAVDPVHADLAALEGRASRSEGGATPRPSPARRRSMRHVELRGVDFRYDGQGEYAVRDLDLAIPPGAAVGIVGGTGAGKSTVVDLILGLLEPTAGQVLVDGADVHSGDLRSWQRSIGYVPQSIYLLDDTIRANIALGREEREIDEDALAAAVRAAQLEGLLRRLPRGLDTRVGERGARLSGGERQRIGIARALYDDPDVLVLDEATSALDTATERAVMDAVAALKGRRTVIMIAHRLGTVRSCDVLYLLRGGRLEAAGSYDELRSASPEFRRMTSG